MAELIFIRHGVTSWNRERRFQGQIDIELSDEGHEQARRTAARLAGMPIVAVYSSDLGRARQTAEAYWKACNPFASMSAVRGLLPDDPPVWIRDRLTGETRTIVVVGHMPHLARLLALLARGVDDGTRDPFPLHGCVALEADGDGWRELWRVEA